MDFFTDKVLWDAYMWSNPTCKGNLMKKGHLRKNWKLRWFILQDKNLFYFRSSSESRPIGYINLDYYIVKKTPSNKRKFGFGLFSPELRSYPLSAMTIEDYCMWTQHLKKATKGVADRFGLSQSDLGLRSVKKSFTEPSLDSPTGWNSSRQDLSGMCTINSSIGQGRPRRSLSTSSITDNRSMAPLPRRRSLVLDHKKPTVLLKRASSDKDYDFFPHMTQVSESDSLVDPNYYSQRQNIKETKAPPPSPIVHSPVLDKRKSLEEKKDKSEISEILTKKENQNRLLTPGSNQQVQEIPKIKENFFISTKTPRKKEINRGNRWSRPVSSDKILDELKSQNLKTQLATMGDYYGVDESQSPEMSPRGEEILKIASLSENRSLGLLNDIMEEISLETVVVDEDHQDIRGKGIRKKVSWREIRRSVLPSSDLKVQGGKHRGLLLSPEEISILAEEGERERIRKLKETYIIKGDPYQKYTIMDRTLGKGAVGEVFSALCGETKMAIKKLQLVRQGKDRLPLILREIEIIATSSHNNIVKYIESYHVENELWVIMEYMSGGSLYDLVKLWPSGCRFNEANTAYCIREVLYALQFLHKRKRIHRDIKVDNILLSMEGDVKLADFGTAVQLTFQRLRRTTAAGTPYYMAPELIKRVPYNEKVDIWSIGITVIELINGQPPFYELDPREALRAIVDRGIMGLVAANLSEEIRDFTNVQCLHIDQDLRPSTSQLLLHPFISFACTKREFSLFLHTTYETFKPSTRSACTIL